MSKRALTMLFLCLIATACAVDEIKKDEPLPNVIMFEAIKTNGESTLTRIFKTPEKGQTDWKHAFRCYNLSGQAQRFACLEGLVFLQGEKIIWVRAYYDPAEDRPKQYYDLNDPQDSEELTELVLKEFDKANKIRKEMANVIALRFEFQGSEVSAYIMKKDKKELEKFNICNAQPDRNACFERWFGKPGWKFVKFTEYYDETK
jgi:hypothetical protein